VKWKADRDQDDNPRLTRKFNKWSGEKFTNTFSLVLSVMHPINKFRLETHVAVIRLKELPSGFRMISAEAERINGLPEVQKNHLRGKVLNNQTNRPENVCEAMFEVESINASGCTSFFSGYGLGMYSDLAAIQKKAATENGRQAELIQILNKEN
jgi:hypothetical protein